MKRLINILNKNFFSFNQKKVFSTFNSVFFPAVSIVLGIGFGCGWQLNAFIRYIDALTNLLLVTELIL